MREVTLHRIIRWKKDDSGKNEIRDDAKVDLDDHVRVEVEDEAKGVGVRYGFYVFRHGLWEKSGSSVRFQNGPMKVAGPDGEFLHNDVNGITCESLLAVVVDRLRGFQKGPLACKDNEVAIESITAAIAALHERTKDREARGVEGTAQK